MSEIEQVMEGVTAGGKWELEPADNGQGTLLVTAGVGPPIAEFLIWPSHETDAAYAARACSTWPTLVKALNRLNKARPETWEFTDAHDEARAALAEALKERE